ncbi:MAG: hypothetical protein GY952_14430 [Rhodobacteraceae bacterium]|nr:hypothetical protein [Paracoccaceae bacterium]
MTALREYERLESLGLWRESDAAQRREVVVSFGAASLVLSDKNDMPIAHWSLAAVRTLNKGEVPTLYAPDKNAQETLEIDDPHMIEAIDKVRDSIRVTRTHPGRLRWVLTGAITLLVGLFAVLWLPLIAADYTARVVPVAKQKQIGGDILRHTNRLTGRPCNAPLAQNALSELSDWLLPEGSQLHIVDMGAKFSTHLPGGHILINRTLVEEHAGPEIAAGFVLMELALAKETPPMKRLFDHLGLRATLTFLANGNLGDDALANFAKSHLTGPLARPQTRTLLPLFARVELTSSPFAHALDNQLKTTRDLADGDPVKGSYRPKMSDGDWIALQAICGDE